MYQSNVLRTAVVASTLACAAGGAFAQTDINWLDAIDGNWSDFSNWSGGSVPNGTDFNAIIAATGSLYTVTLDLDISLNGFELSWGGATLDMFDRSLTTADSFLLRGGSIISSATSGAGSLSLTGSSTIDGGTINGLSGVAVSAGSALDIQGASSFSNTILSTTGGTIIFSSSDDTDVDGTCIDGFDAGTIFLSGSGGVNLSNGSGFHIDGTSSLIIEDDATAITGINEGERIVNEGKLVKTALLGKGPAPAIGGPFLIDNLEFVNTGTVRVESGELVFGTNTGIIDGTNGVLETGTWEIVDNSTLTFDDQFVSSLNQGVHVLIDGADSAFDAINGLNNIQQGASFTVSGGKNFVVGNGISVGGLLRVGEGSAFDAQSGLNNIDGSTIFGGTFEIGGELIIDNFGDQITELRGASLTLIGEGSAVLMISDEPVDAIAGLHAIRDGGTFAITEGRSFTTVGDLAVGLPGDSIESTLRVGEGSALDVTGMLTNFGANGDFVDGIFDIAGTLTATNAQIKTIFNDVTLDGVVSNILDDSGNDAFSFLERIAEPGILRLLNGRTIDGIGDIIVDGTLIIDSGSGLGGEAGDAVFSTVGDLYISPTAIVELVLNDPAQLAGISVDGAVDFGATGEAGTLVLSLGDGYMAQAGDSFVVIDGAMLGRFAAVDGLDLGGGLSLELSYTGSGLFVSIVPAPASIGLLALGGLVASRRRR